MKTTIPLALAAALTLIASSAPAQVRVLNDHGVEGIIHNLQEVDFESLAPDQAVPNPLTLNGITFSSR